MAMATDGRAGGDGGRLDVAGEGSKKGKRVRGQQVAAARVEIDPWPPNRLQPGDSENERQLRQTTPTSPGAISTCHLMHVTPGPHFGNKTPGN